ncbi:MAG: radical SAM protein [Candidatus Methanogaster sp.]|uniref:Radical SAM protein n=1 Tax=Candidatus Methanogaster sp. TaxID=3386292 RepID=A0AC61KXW6_9EURY|nr:MAG: radical SAM protein [ANME-2 cluster archaeon]
MGSFFFRSGGHRVRLECKSDPGATLLLRRIDGGAGGTRVAGGGDGVDTSIGDGAGDAHIAVGDDGGDDVVIFYKGRELVRGRIEPALLHCPEQAYITLSESCIFNCTFCPVPKLRGRTKTADEVLRMVDDASRTGNLRAISITSGIERSPGEEVTRAVDLVKTLTKYNLPIGVSVYPTGDSSIRLKEAGAVEIKYNVETMDREIFGRACADMDLDFVLASLKDAVDIFGRNRVFSNFIIGLGESDGTVREGVETLAEIGVIPILRALNPHPLRPDLADICPDAARPGADRLLRLARFEREVLDAHGLRARVAETMCLPCGGCDLVVHWDV